MQAVLSSTSTASNVDDMPPNGSVSSTEVEARSMFAVLDYVLGEGLHHLPIAYTGHTMLRTQAAALATMHDWLDNLIDILQHRDGRGFAGLCFCMYVCVHVCMDVCVYVCMYVCMYV